MVTAHDSCRRGVEALKNGCKFSVIPLIVGQGRCLCPSALGGLLWPIESGSSNTSRKDHAASTLCPAPVRKPWPGTEVVWRGSSPGVLPAQVPDLEMKGFRMNLAEAPDIVGQRQHGRIVV